MVGRVYGDDVNRRVRALVCVLTLVPLSACVRTGNPDACGAPIAERIDSNSSQHVLPGGPVPAYLTNPPTSGAHRPGPEVDEVVESELDEPTQVGILESGRVLIQYRDNSLKAELEELASNRVTVAPNDSLPTKIVATAWLHKLECSALSSSDLRSFIDDHAQKAPGH